MSSTSVRIGHWLPIRTTCPVNNMPDFIYVYVTFVDHFEELYSVRKAIKRICSGRKEFMEDLAQEVLNEFQDASKVEVILMTGRHKVEITR